MNTPISLRTADARFLADGYPELEKLAVEYYRREQLINTAEMETLACVGRLIDLTKGPRTVAVVGCGAKPHSIQRLRAAGFHATGVEPVAGWVVTGNEFLNDPNAVHLGAAEQLPYEDGSQRVVLLDSVFEHVDSPSATLREAYRVLEPGGVAYIYTTNRYRISLTGHNYEFDRRFYNWYPATLKEAYVFHHLHYEPKLANYSLRPAVHWWSYSDLCKAGREAGFAKFYSRIDLIQPQGRWQRRIIERVRRSPWLRAVALLQFGNSIFMLKRPG